MTRRAAPALFVAGLLVAADALAATPTPKSNLDVTASCERKAAKGRVICDVELEIASGRIAWADVVVTAAPPFAPPLRSRVSMAEARSRTEKRLRIPVALVATSLGRGTVSLQARAAVCDGTGRDETCRPSKKDVTAELIVGTDIEP